MQYLAMMCRPLFHFAIALLAASSLSACVSNASVIDRHATAEQAEAKAIVIVSVSHDRGFSGAYARFFMDGGTPDAVKVESAAGPFEIPVKNHFHDKYGHVYVLEVAPGHHRFTGWSAGWRNLHTVGGAGPGPMPLEFDVARGDVLYIGNLHANWQVGKGLLGNREPYSTTVDVIDNSKVDIGIAERATPAIAGRARVALLPLGHWMKAPAQSDSAANGGAQSSSDQAIGN
jgi:hypothetical protein